MGLFDVGLIQQRYEENGHFYYPEMKKLIDDVIKDPEKEIVIPDNFVIKSLENGHFLIYLIQKIAILFQKLFKNFLCFFSSDYRKRYRFAVHKIKEAYKEKVASVSTLANALMISREAFQKAVLKSASLEMKIQALTKETTLHQDRLQKNIDTKNLIVQQARSLQTKRNQQRDNSEPIFTKKLGKFFSKVVKKTEPEIASIKEQDAFFPLEELTEKLILTYENEEFTTSPFIKELIQEKIHVREKQRSLEAKQLKFTTADSLARVAAARIEKISGSIKDLNLENFFNDDELKEPALFQKAEKMPQRTAKEMRLTAMREDIANKTTSKDLAILFSTLINRLPENAIADWTCDNEGLFTLKLNKTYNIWMPENDITGGAVIMLGYKKKGVIQGNLQNNKISFHSGINSYVKVKVLGYIAPDFAGIVFNSRTDILIEGAYLGQTRLKQRTFSSLRGDWEKNGVLISENYAGGYRKFLEEKVADR